MSSTRHAEKGSPLRQERWASSPEYERGLMANIVARRCSVVEAPEDRELIWFLQYVSWQEGGLGKLSKEICEGGNGTPAMRKLGLKPGAVCGAEQVRAIRKEIPHGEEKFILRGEMTAHEKLCVDGMLGDTGYSPEAIKSESSRRPDSYPAETFYNLCATAAGNLENHLKEICLNPEIRLAFADPWYFSGLVEALRKRLAEWQSQRRARTVVTKVGKVIYEELEFSLATRCLTLAEGAAGAGKSYAARAWCEMHPGRARYVEVPPGNDDKGFFRAIARALGVSNHQSSKAVELRDRIEDVLASGDLLLCMDEAHRMWPQAHLRDTSPNRINWVMAMINQDVPLFMVSAPQFLELQKNIELQTRWNSVQWERRFEYKQLPGKVSTADLIAVAQALLPSADEITWKAVAAYANGATQYLSAIESIRRRAIYLASRAGRADVLKKDIVLALGEKSEADMNLSRAIRAATPAGRRRRAESATDAPEPREAPAVHSPEPRGQAPAQDRSAGDIKPDLQPSGSRVSPLVTLEG